MSDCRVYWGSHGCDKPRGHWWRHRCGPPDDVCTRGFRPPYTAYFGEDVRVLDRVLTWIWHYPADLAIWWHRRKMRRWREGLTPLQRAMYEALDREVDRQILYGDGEPL